MRRLALAATLVLPAIALPLISLPSPAAACPDFTQSGDTYALSGETMYQPVAFDVVAGGENSIVACGIVPLSDQGDGSVAEAPDFTFNITGMSRYRLDISVVSECDSVLLINSASVGWYYDDDDNGNGDAKIVLNRPLDGWLDVWVGTFDGSYCDAVLTLETFDR